MDIKQQDAIITAIQRLKEKAEQEPRLTIQELQRAAIRNLELKQTKNVSVTL